jgi:hypothetical protein
LQGLDVALDERAYLWWLLAMSAVKIGDQVFNWQSISSACGQFAATNWNAAQCVWAAVSSTLVYGTTFMVAYRRIGNLATWLGNNGISIGNFRRDIDQGFLDDLSAAFGMTVHQLGVFQIPTTNATIATRSEGHLTRVLGFTTPEGQPMHFAYMGNTTTHHHLKFAFGNGTTTTSTSIRGRQQYNEQYFSQGGIDFIINDNVNDGGVLSQTYDYGQMDHEVSCYMANNMDAQ